MRQARERLQRRVEREEAVLRQRQVLEDAKNFRVEELRVRHVQECWAQIKIASIARLRAAKRFIKV